MASSNACGSAALLIQHYSQLFSGGAMRASTLKGLLIHTADDSGWQDSPTWFLGAADPQSAANSRLRTVDNNSDPDYFIFSYHRDAGALSAGAQATVDYSSDLASWLPAVHDGSDIIIDDSEDSVHVRVRRFLAEEGRLFLRLNVQRN